MADCYRLFEGHTGDLQYPRDTLECLGIDKVTPPMPEKDVALQLHNSIDRPPEIACLTSTNAIADFIQPSHPPDRDPEEVLNPNGVEVTQEFEQIIAMIHTLNGTRRVLKDHDIRGLSGSSSV